MTELERQQADISDSLISLFEGKDKHLSMVAAMSIAVTTGFMLGIPKIELQKLMMRMYDKRVRENSQPI